MKILLINPPDEIEYVLGIGKEFVQKYEPLGILYIAAVLRENGYEVSVIDAHAQKLSIQDLKRMLLELKADIVGFSTFTCNGAIVYALGQWLKNTASETLVVLGNIHASVYAQQYLENRCCDIVVHGDGEYTFLKIIKFYKKELALNEIPGISFLDKRNEYCKTSSGELIQNLAELPFPARELVDQRLYNLTNISNQFYFVRKGDIAKTMSTSRGCLYHCSFCAVHNNSTQRLNSSQRVVDEIKLLWEKYNASYITMVDSLFMSNKERLLEICSGIRKLGVKIKWDSNAHVHYITPNVVEEMESAGCHELDFGIESGVQRLLDNVHKGTTISQIKEAIDTVRRHSKIHVVGLFVLGLPGETYQDSLQTIDFAKSLPLDMAQFSICVPYPGSILFKELSQRGELDTGIRPNGQIDVSVWKRYSSYILFTRNIPVWITPGLSYPQIKKLQKTAFREFYLRKEQILKQAPRVRLNNLFELVRLAIRAFF